MSTLARWYVRTALAYLVASLVIGVILAARDVVIVPPLVGALTPVYFHLFMVGWATQTIFGVAYWMFPRLSRERPRGSESAGVATYALLNLGLLLRAAAEPLHMLGPGSGWGSLVVLSAVLQWLSGLLFVANTWGRVKER